MIELKRGDIFEQPVEALVNPANCVGVMGRGLALQFKKSFPQNFNAYAAACKRKEVCPGKMFVFDTGETEPRFIINFPTKRHWRNKSRIEDIEAGLENLATVIEELGIKSFAVPPLGSGLGGLDWLEVRTRIEEALRGLENAQVILLEPDD